MIHFQHFLEVSKLGILLLIFPTLTNSKFLQVIILRRSPPAIRPVLLFVFLAIGGKASPLPGLLVLPSLM